MDEARTSVAVVLVPEPVQRPRRRGRKVEVGASLRMRREVLRQMAPHYQEASSAHKRVIVEDVIRLTGYHRKYAMWLLNHAQEEHQMVKRPSRGVYGTEVEEALVQVWEQTNHLCSKRLIPFLPTAIEAMERHDHLHLTQECRSQLLSLSAATVDRMLRPYRQHEMRGLCTTRAGTLLKSNIPIRTFEQWDEQVPGFVEADLVAHCGSSVEGTYLFTLTLTDIATGWTECLPLPTKSAEAVLAAVKQARSLFPFPLLGLDTDNGTEFINDALLVYCEQEHITFTRGRPALKNDQCYVEQKNGHVVRQVVGYYRYVGEQAFACLGELYRVLSLYVNFFQPSMKLCAKFKEGRKVRRIYDEAKTPLTRLSQAEVLPAEHERDLVKQFEDLDFVRVLEQAKQAQQALFRYATGIVPQSEKRRRLFADERFRVVGLSLVPSTADALVHPEPVVGLSERASKDEKSAILSLLEWHRTRNDPFQEQWERIAEWMCTDQTRCCRAMFEELCRLSPDRYQPSHLRTLQRGVHKIRARLADVEMYRQKDVQNAGVVPFLVAHEREEILSADSGIVKAFTLEAEESEPHEEANEQEVSVLAFCPTEDVAYSDTHAVRASVQEYVPENASHMSLSIREEHLPDVVLVSGPSSEPTKSCKHPMSITIEEAVGAYLDAQQQAKRRPKTMEWHQTALSLFGQYLRMECHVTLLAEMTEKHVHGWMESFRLPTVRGSLRSEGTRHSYARSARAWCQWLVNAGLLRQTPFADVALVRVEPAVMHPLEVEEWERLLLACESPGEHGVIPEWAPARNRALLWVLYDTGMRLSEACALRLGDVDLEQGMLLVRRDGFKGRRLPLGQKALDAVRVYVERYRLSGRRACVEQGGSEKPLFLSETGYALTENGMVSVFGRLRERAGLKREEIGPTLLRDSFAVRYLQVGGDVFTLRDLLGQNESAVVKRFLQRSEQKVMKNER